MTIILAAIVPLAILATVLVVSHRTNAARRKSKKEAA